MSKLIRYIVRQVVTMKSCDPSSPLPLNQVGVKSSNAATMMHILKGNIGTGILAMPSAFYNSGLLVGSIALPVLGVVAIYCMHMLISCQEEICRRLSILFLDYEDVAEKTFENGPIKCRSYSKMMGRFVFSFLLITQIGFCCVYSLFSSEALKEIVAKQTGQDIKLVWFVFALLFPMIGLIQIRQLSSLAYTSAIANGLQSLGLAYLIISLCIGMPSPSSVAAVGDFARFPLFFGTAIYAFEGIGIVLPIKKDMLKPKDFATTCGVLNTSMVIISALYLIMGTFGYIHFGKDVSANITLNLPAGVLNDLCRLAFGIAIFLSYPLQAYVPITMLWSLITAKGNIGFHPNVQIYERVFRAIFVTLTFVIGASVPKLDLFISLVGAFSSSCLALILPPLLDMVLWWDVKKVEPKVCRLGWMFKNGVIMFLGILGFITGTYISMKEIIMSFNGEDKLQPVIPGSNGTTTADPMTTVTEFMTTTLFPSTVTQFITTTVSTMSTVATSTTNFTDSLMP